MLYCYLVPLRPKYSPQHPILKHPQPTFLPQYQRPSFTPIRNNGQYYSSIYLDLLDIYKNFKILGIMGVKFTKYELYQQNITRVQQSGTTPQNDDNTFSLTNTYPSFGLIPQTKKRLSIIPKEY